MKTVLSVFAIAAVLFAISVLWFAAPNKTVTIDEVVSLHCAAEWAKFEGEKPKVWTTLNPIEIDPTLDAAATDAFNKYTVAVIALADYMGVFVGFSAETNQTLEYSDVARAKFDLTMCLLPTEAERDLIVDVARSTTGASDDAIRAKMFEGFDQFECMQFAKASEAIFSVESFPFDYKTITEANMKTCN